MESCWVDGIWINKRSCTMCHQLEFRQSLYSVSPVTWLGLEWYTPCPSITFVGSLWSESVSQKGIAFYSQQQNIHSPKHDQIQKWLFCQYCILRMKIGMCGSGRLLFVTCNTYLRDGVLLWGWMHRHYAKQMHGWKKISLFVHWTYIQHMIRIDILSLKHRKS